MISIVIFIFLYNCFLFYIKYLVFNKISVKRQNIVVKKVICQCVLEKRQFVYFLAQLLIRFNEQYPIVIN